MGLGGSRLTHENNVFPVLNEIPLRQAQNLLPGQVRGQGEVEGVQGLGGQKTGLPQDALSRPVTKCFNGGG